MNKTIYTNISLPSASKDPFSAADLVDHAAEYIGTLGAIHLPTFYIDEQFFYKKDKNNDVDVYKPTVTFAYYKVDNSKKTNELSFSSKTIFKNEKVLISEVSYGKETGLVDYASFLRYAVDYMREFSDKYQCVDFIFHDNYDGEYFLPVVRIYMMADLD